MVLFGETMADERRREAIAVIQWRKSQEAQGVKQPPLPKPEPLTLLLWEPATRSLRGTLPGDVAQTTAAGFAPSGRFVALGGADGVIRLWDVAAEKELTRLRGHRGPVRSLAFSGDGRLLVSGSADVTALSWDVSSLLKPAALPRRDLSTATLAKLWEELSSLDAAKAFPAVRTMAGNPEQALALLREKLHPVPHVPAGRLTRLIVDLDSDRFAVRQRAMDELRRLGRTAESALKQALADRPSLDARRRMEQLLGETEKTGIDPEQLRQSRALLALEYANGAEARKLLERLAAGAPGAWLTEEAKAALRRLGS
jgi:hypothetical protein